MSASGRLALAALQFAPVPRDVAGNAGRIAGLAHDSGADLVVTPELALTGYDLGDDVASLGAALEPDSPAVAALEACGDVVLGMVERSAGGACFNVAAHLRAGRLLFRHRKVYLPTYGMFDEGRFFGRGERVRAYDAGHGWRAGLLVCEDLWHPALPYVLAAAGIQLLIVLAAAPGRGVWDGGEGGGLFRSADVWERLVRTTAQVYGIYVVLVNRIGADGGLVFAGGSMIAGPWGEVLARAPDDAEAVVTAELSLDEVARARRPYAHLRDDDPRLTIRELARLLDGAHATATP